MDRQVAPLVLESVRMIAEMFIAMEVVRMRAEHDRYMRELLSPEEYKAWKQECETERRHNELCKAIRDAGENARPRGLGLFL